MARFATQQMTVNPIEDLTMTGTTCSLVAAPLWSGRDTKSSKLISMNPKFRTLPEGAIQTIDIVA